MKFINSDIDIEVIGDRNEEMTDEEFFNFCAQNRDLRIERDENGQILIMAPVNVEDGNQNGTIFGELYVWNTVNKSGECFDSSTGYTLADKSVLSPDASWIPLVKWNAIPKEERQKHIDALKASTEDYRNHVAEQSPVGPIDAYQIILLMSAHTVRHSKQIDEVKLSAGYPVN